MRHHPIFRVGAVVLPTLFALVLPAVLQGCTDVGLYQWKTTPYQANKLAVTGTVCTDDLHQSDFPIKILFMIDVSNALRSTPNDPNGMRGKAIEDMIGLWGKNPNYNFGITIFGSKAKNLLTDSTGQKPIGFTRDFSKLSSAVAQIKAGGGSTDVSACRAGHCRDIRAAVSLANSIISGDILAADPGEIARTTYVLILFSGGAPIPAIQRCGCRDKEEELAGGKWEGCPWIECECQVTCPTDCTQSATVPWNCSVCASNGRECEAKCPGGCASDEYCDPTLTDQLGNWLCVVGQPASPPTVPPVKSIPPSVPDTFSFGVLPPTSPSACNSAPVCLFSTGGNTQSCEETLLVKDVRELYTFAIKNGAGQFQFHTTYLPDKETRSATDPYYPPAPCAGDQAAEDARTTRLLSQMAYAASGGFTKFVQAGAIPQGFMDIGRALYSSSDALVFKELVVFNRNVLAQSEGIYPDTDADGLVDETETKLGTCISDEDTDGDGLKDSVETKLALDPLVADKPVECIDLLTGVETDDDPCSPGQSKTWTRYTEDKDHDELNRCEERLLGTDDSLFDTDADGIPDRIEFLVGTNYMAVDPLQDSDLDGMVNRDEVRGHTDPRSNDSQDQLDLAYRYEEVDEGLKQVLSYEQPSAITGVQIKNVAPQTTPGVGWLKFDPANSDAGVCQSSTPCFTLSWRDYGDMDAGGNFGPAVDITKTSKEGYTLTSCRSKSGGGCTDDSVSKFITVFVSGPKTYPPKALVEKINISAANRNCVRFTVRNITLMETGMDRVLKTNGNNTVDIYFAEAPQRAKSGYGIFRIASQRLRYVKGPPEDRTPRTPEISFTDEEFILDIAQ